jgi:acyl-CoA synthetase (AMP-forming)/AMP-acid ligase II
MLGMMMDVPLTIGSILDHAKLNNPQREIVSLSSVGIHRYTVSDFALRVAQLANALSKLGVKKGDRVASFAWNSYRHLELYYAVPMLGAVLHTVNIRLYPAQVMYVLNHADSRVVFFDNTLTPGIEAAIAADTENRKRHYICMGTLNTKLKPCVEYEEFIGSESTTFESPVLDEREAAILCYTSATTGEPKGVLFSHRSTVLHAFGACLPSVMGVSALDTALPIVPMFHVCAWGYPYATLLIGAKLVFNGEIFDAARLIDLMNSEEVTTAAAVPTIWMRIRDEMHSKKIKLETVEKILVGGSAVPPSLMKDFDQMGIEVIHGYGMTETSPLVATTRKSLTASLADAPEEVKMAQRIKQGRIAFGVQWRAIDEQGKQIAHDGKAMGEVQYRGPWIASGYYGNPEATKAAITSDGWFRTGDVCTVDEHGFMQIVDRTKDLVKSGGEWISSIDLENTIMGHECIKEAAVIGVPHADWVERPVAVVVLKPGTSLSESALKDWLAYRVAKWWIPDRVMFTDSLPLTGVGKFLKRELREKYKDVLTEQTNLDQAKKS